MGKHVNPLEAVERYNLCAGCGLCEGLFGPERIEIKLDENGFLRPVQHDNLTLEESFLLNSVCPGLNVRHFDTLNTYDPVWGPIKSIHTAAAVDKEVRKCGSSGGVLSAIQLYLLESGKVDFIIGTSAAGDNPLGNEINICRTREDVIHGAGSRYAPSAPLKNISKLLDSPGQFAFVGKPCDVAALRRLGQYDQRVTNKISLFLSFMCAGVPSQCGSHRIINTMGTNIDDVVSFRYRGDGWPGLTKAILKDGTTRSMSYVESWGNILSQYVQWRCKLCPDGTGEFADITCADAWHLNNDGSPDFSEQEGKSFILARNDLGSKVISNCVSANAITIIDKSNTRHLQSVQFHQSYRRRTLLVRYIAIVLLLMKCPVFNYKYLFIASSKIGILALCRAFLGSIKRGYKL